MINGTDSEAMDMILSWISDCRSNHEVCRREQPSVRSRKFERIIDVGRIQSEETVQLCHAKDMPHDAAYTTLSHCWGGADILVLKESAHKQFQESISFEDLPQTFKDAVEFTRRLRIQYLWIDSLCIIQDSNEDWLKHAGLMDQIYQGSFCNIAATSAANPHGGLFVERSPVLITPLRTRIKDALSENIDGFYDVGGDFSVDWMNQVSMSPLGKRAWVIQERLLSPRVVHFAKSRLFWECSQLRTCESSTIGGISQSGWRHEKVDFKKWDPFSKDLTITPSVQSLRPSYVWSSLKAMLDPDQVKIDKDLLTQDSKALARATRACYGEEHWTRTHPMLSYWAAIVINYGNAALTRIDDRLIAIAGLAKILSSRTGIRFIVGHWLYQVPRQLLWSSVDLPTSEEHDHYIAPSWSWASRPIGLVSNMRLPPLWEEKGAMDLIKVLDVDIQSTHADDFTTGQLKSATLRVRGRLLPIELDLQKWPEPCSRKDRLVQYWHPSVRDAPKRETFLVPVLFTRWHKKLPAATPNALLLESLSTKGTFRRIGTANLSSLCNLRYTIPHLYQAKLIDHGEFYDDDNDAATDDEANIEKTPVAEEKLRNEEARTLSPREELHEKRMAMIASPKFQDPFQKLLKRVENLPPSQGAAVASRLSRFNRTIDAHTVRPPSNMQKFIIDDDFQEKVRKITREVRAEHGIEGKEEEGVIVQAGEKVVEVPKIAPREVVGEHFWRECLEDDGDAVRYGCFVFDIV